MIETKNKEHALQLSSHTHFSKKQTSIPSRTHCLNYYPKQKKTYISIILSYFELRLAINKV